MQFNFLRKLHGEGRDRVMSANESRQLAQKLRLYNKKSKGGTVGIGSGTGAVGGGTRPPCGS